MPCGPHARIGCLVNWSTLTNPWLSRWKLASVSRCRHPQRSRQAYQSAWAASDFEVPSDTLRWPICVQEWRQGLWCEAMDPSFSWDVAVASGGGISEVIGLCNQHLPADSALFNCSLRKPARFESQSGRVDESPTFVIWARQRGGASQGAGRWSSPRRSLVDCTPVPKLGAAND